MTQCFCLPQPGQTKPRGQRQRNTASRHRSSLPCPPLMGKFDRCVGIFVLIGCAGKRERAARAETLRHQEALAVVVVDHREVQACHGVSGQRVGRVPRQQIDLAGLQGGQPHLRVQRHIADFRVVAENRRRDRPADIDVKSAPMAFAIRSAEAVQVVGDAADQLLSCPDRVQGGSGARLRRDDSDRKRGDNSSNKSLHNIPGLRLHGSRRL